MFATPLYKFGHICLVTRSDTMISVREKVWKRQSCPDRGTGEIMRNVSQASRCFVRRCRPFLSHVGNTAYCSSHFTGLKWSLALLQIAVNTPLLLFVSPDCTWWAWVLWSHDSIIFRSLQQDKLCSVRSGINVSETSGTLFNPLKREVCPTFKA
jgi:hypothetical protein